jgi:hypothetical protein
MLTEPKPSLEWEAVGGDEVNRRIAGVVQRRVRDDLRVRWKFDFEAGRLLAATVGTDSQPEASHWFPADAKDLDAGRFPASRLRRDEAGNELQIEVQKLAASGTAERP